MKERLIMLTNNVNSYIKKHSPEILTGIGIAGMVSSTILAVKATPKALKMIEDVEQQEGIKLKPIDVVKIAYKPYIPSVLTMIPSIACLIFANHIHSKRTAAFATAYSVTEQALNRYKEKVIETIGEKKEKEISNNVSQEIVDNNQMCKNQVVITSKGNTLILDSLSGRYFRSDMDSIKKAINDINRRLLSENTVSLNEFYEYLGLESIKNGWDIGWNIDKGLIDVTFSTCISNNDEPCLVIDYTIEPKQEYLNLY